MAHLRIFNNTLIGHQTQVFYVNDDGKEIPINNALTSVEVKMSVNNINEAVVTITALADINVKAKLKKLVEEEMKLDVAKNEYGRKGLRHWD